MGGVIAPLMFSVKHNFECDGWFGNFCVLCYLFLFAFLIILCQKFTSFGVQDQFSIRTGFSDFHDSGQLQRKIFSI